MQVTFSWHETAEVWTGLSRNSLNDKWKVYLHWWRGWGGVEGGFRNKVEPWLNSFWLRIIESKKICHFFKLSMFLLCIIFLNFKSWNVQKKSAHWAAAMLGHYQAEALVVYFGTTAHMRTTWVECEAGKIPTVFETGWWLIEPPAVCLFSRYAYRQFFLTPQCFGFNLTLKKLSSAQDYSRRLSYLLAF